MDHLHNIISRLLVSCDKYIRYDHHIHLINSYLREHRIPRGFRINFHSNLVPDDLNFNNILFNSSKKLMIKTIGHYKPQLSVLCEKIKLDLSAISTNYQQALGGVLERVQSKIKSKANILHVRRRKKFTRDNLPNFKLHNEIPVNTCTRISQLLLGHVLEAVSAETDLIPDPIACTPVVNLPIKHPSLSLSPISASLSLPVDIHSPVSSRLRSIVTPNSLGSPSCSDVEVEPTPRLQPLNPEHSESQLPDGSTGLHVENDPVHSEAISGPVSTRLRSRVVQRSSMRVRPQPHCSNVVLSGSDQSAATAHASVESTRTLEPANSFVSPEIVDTDSLGKIQISSDDPAPANPLVSPEVQLSSDNLVPDVQLSSDDLAPANPLVSHVIQLSSDDLAPTNSLVSPETVVGVLDETQPSSDVQSGTPEPTLPIDSHLSTESHEPINRSTTLPILPDSFVSLCSKGPSFVPTPTQVDWRSLKLDFDNFANRIRMIANSYDPSNEKKTPSSENANLKLDDLPPKKQKSRFKVPKSNIPAVEAYLTAMETAIFKSVTNTPCKDNLTPSERSALGDWRKNVLFNPESEVVLRMQDKGNRFLVVDKTEDIEKAQAQISRSSFLEVPDDLTGRHIKIVTEWVEKWESRGEINKQWGNFIKNPDAVPGKNSTLYKTHKDSVPVRLLTTGCNTPTENLSRFVEKHTAPLALNIPSRIKDTDHFLEIIDQINTDGLPDNVSLVSFDIVNMFPSISNEHGVRTVQKALQRRSKKHPSTQCIIEALKITLTCNNSKFNGRHLLQTDGTAMGAPNSCSYADLATAPIDDQVYEAQKSTFPEIFVYYKFRDDVFNLWAGDVFRIDDFLDFLNSLDDNIKFTLEIGVLFKPTVELPPGYINHLIGNIFPSSPSELLRSSQFEIIENSLFLMWTKRISEIQPFAVLLHYSIRLQIFSDNWEA